jgi:hypothetical protein
MKSKDLQHSLAVRIVKLEETIEELESKHED